MSFQKIQLRKLLTAFGSSKKKLVTIIRSDIRLELAKENGIRTGGGDFHAPFWSDAKEYVLHGADLEDRTKTRVSANSRRKRLYPELAQGFDDWWKNKKRFNNENIEPFPSSIKGKLEFEELEATIKLENFLGLMIGVNEKRLIYPYFSEEPELAPEIARLGLWALSEAFPQYPVRDFRILDVLRGNSISVQDVALKGTERAEFAEKLSGVLRLWRELRAEY